MFGGETAAEYCDRILPRILRLSNLGDVALIAWAAAELQHGDLRVAVERLRDLLCSDRHDSTVETAWALSGLLAARHQLDVEADLEATNKRLERSFNRTSALFAHWTHPRSAVRGRSHVACFADQVYPIQALARYHSSFNNTRSLTLAEACAAQICARQGRHGQWWWHYDVRTGDVIEGYPVYSVHQDAMAPMALIALAEAGGTDHAESICRGLSWMKRAPEVAKSLIDDEHVLIWRKVGRPDPWKLVRAARAVMSRIHRGARLQWMDALFPANRIEYECRPYHFGWLLFTWLERE